MRFQARGIRLPTFGRNDTASVKARSDISTQFAQGASGTVRAVIGQTLHPDAVWLTRELDALTSNMDVERIVTADPKTLTEMTVFERVRGERKR